MNNSPNVQPIVDKIIEFITKKKKNNNNNTRKKVFGDDDHLQQTAMNNSNNAIIYKETPNWNFPENGKHLAFVKRDYTFDKDELLPNEFITENLYLSIDPYQRMVPKYVKSIASSFKVGKPITCGGVARIYKSNNENFKEGQLIYSPRSLEWAEYSKFRQEDVINCIIESEFRVLENKYNLPLSNYVGALGMAGMTAFSSFYEIGKPKFGETIFISSASGAVGQIVGQIAKKEGLYVVGSAGSDDKVEYLIKELKFDGAFNYKTKQGDLREVLLKYCPKGIDIYFDNVGGEILEAVLDLANSHARIIVCGMISEYNTDNRYGIKNLVQVLIKNITMQGFHVENLWSKYEKEFYAKMEKWLSEGSVVYKEDIADGLENGADAFIGMLKGRNFGKAMIAVKGKDKKF